MGVYRSKIDAQYLADEAKARSNGIVNMNVYGIVYDIVKSIITAWTDIDTTALSPTADLFQLGLDSMQVTVITRNLNNFLSTNGYGLSIEPRMIYSNPSISAFTVALLALIEGKAPVSSYESEEQKMKRLYKIHAASMPISGRPIQPKSSGGHIFLLTGSTGSLGSYILDSLQRDFGVIQIYCLSRGPDSFNRQQESQSAKGLRPPSWKVICLNAELSKPYFGLSPEQYRELLNEVTHVIHNAWQVDFNLTIDSFVNSIYSVRQLIDFSAHSRFGAQLFFVSSISSVGGRTGTTTERIFRDWSTPGALGYGQSKFVSELLLDTAAREAGIPTIVCRVGQISGPTTTKGMWPKQEWLPSLIASPKYLGKIPYSLGHMETIDWIPVDVLGKAIVELATHPPKEESGATVYHVVNPYHTTWGNLLHIVMRHLNREKEIETVSLEEWLKALRESAPRTEDLSRNPAVKLLDFFESLAGWNTAPTPLSTSNSFLASQALTGLGPVKEEWMENWMRQWAF